MNRYLEKAAEISTAEKAGYSMVAAAPVLHGVNSAYKKVSRSIHDRVENAEMNALSRYLRLSSKGKHRVAESIYKKKRALGEVSNRYFRQSLGHPLANFLPKRMAVAGLVLAVPATINRMSQ